MKRLRNLLQMTTTIAIEDVRREVKILRALTGHRNLVQFYDAYEDEENVYIVMELCKGGELLDWILARGGKYSEDDAKAVMVQLLSVVSYCHLQQVVHRDLKGQLNQMKMLTDVCVSDRPLKKLVMICMFCYGFQNFLFVSKDENSPLKDIDFILSDYVKPYERLNDIVGSELCVTVYAYSDS
uniref:Protein kinase domain-containing protein n=1 Tax=Solanum lycopersicum TaxID=4081 RepID=A0A3Q7IGU4_SOLLC